MPMSVGRGQETYAFTVRHQGGGEGEGRKREEGGGGRWEGGGREARERGEKERERQGERGERERERERERGGGGGGKGKEKREERRRYMYYNTIHVHICSVCASIHTCTLSLKLGAKNYAVCVSLLYEQSRSRHSPPLVDQRDRRERARREKGTGYISHGRAWQTPFQ